MDSEPPSDKTPLLINTNNPFDSDSDVASSSVIYIEPEKEAAARKKFDKYLVPVSLIFIVLSSLDRNSVSEALCFLESGLFTNSQIAWKC